MCSDSLSISSQLSWENSQYLLYPNPFQIFMAPVPSLGASIYSGFLAMVRTVEVAGIMTSQSLWVFFFYFFILLLIIAVIIGKRK